MSETSDIQIAFDICAPTLARRVAALLDQDPNTVAEGDPLPRGWHVALFTASTRQSDLRADGVGGLGFTLPPSDLPRMVMGGRRTRFLGDIPIGARVTRHSHIGAIIDKVGRAGPMRVMTVVHRISVDPSDAPVLEEEQDYIMLGEAPPDAERATPARRSSASGVAAMAQREIRFDETMLFRYSAITFNAHRIHYDKDYARDREGYASVLVNGGLSTLFLLEMFKSLDVGVPTYFAVKNIAPLYCGRTATLSVSRAAEGYDLWLHDDEGQPLLTAQARADS